MEFGPTRTRKKGIPRQKNSTKKGELCRTDGATENKGRGKWKDAVCCCPPFIFKPSKGFLSAHTVCVTGEGLAGRDLKKVRTLGQGEGRKER